MKDAAALHDVVSSMLRRLRGSASADARFFVPGRIEVLGKHTDYAGGRSLLMATDRGFAVATLRRSDDAVRIVDCGSGEQVEFGPDLRAKHEPPPWATYPATVLRRCALNFPEARGGADILFASNLPQAAGLSSSSALVVATFLALEAVRGLSKTRAYTSTIQRGEDLAGYLGAVENGMAFGPLAGAGGVGTMGGSEDHTAILCARAGRLVQYSFAPVRFEREVELSADWIFAVASSGVRAEKAGAALEQYNRLAASTRRLVQIWVEAHGGSGESLGAIVNSEPDAALRLRELVRRGAADDADMLLNRLTQFIAESDEIVPGAGSALDRGDIAGFSAHVRRSQHLAENALQNQIAETTALVQIADELGAAAASAFGAGFGGSVWALVRASDAADFLISWRSTYGRRFPARRDSAAFFSTTAAAPATRLTTDAS